MAARYGFEEYDGPPLEPLELYTAKSGDEIVGQLYNFEDKGERQVALRPEMTPTLARMVAARANGLRKPIRWFSIPQLFRYERQQRGRLREHFQLNCDLIGEPGPGADAEIIALAVDVMRALGLGREGLQGAALRPAGARRAVCAHRGSRRRRWRCGARCSTSSARTPMEVSRQKLRDAGVERSPTLEAIIGLARGEELGGRCPIPRSAARVAPLLEVVRLLDAMGLGEFVDLDLTIVRGLAYYTGTVFELFDAKGELRAICGGGRYDNLLGALGGVDLPALGFGMGDVVLGELLKERGLLPATEPRLDVFVATVTDEDRAARAGAGAPAARRGHQRGVRAGVPGARQAAQAGRCAGRALRRRDRPRRPGPRRSADQGPRRPPRNWRRNDRKRVRVRSPRLLAG